MKESVKAYESAVKRMKDIKDFYKHLTAYILVNMGLLVLRIPILNWVMGNSEVQNEGFFEWFDLNILLTPAIWGLALLIHALAVFGKRIGFINRWEERQIRKYMEEDRTEPCQFH